MILSAGVVNPLDDPVEAQKLEAEIQAKKDALNAKREKDESTKKP